MKFFARILIVLLFIGPKVFSQQKSVVTVKGNQLQISYAGKLLLDAQLTAQANPYRINNQQQIIDGAAYQIITIAAGNFKSFECNAIILGTDEAIACESEPQNGLRVVRHTVGPSHNLKNNAVYDRQKDLLVSFDARDPKIKVVPLDKNRFEVNVKGWEVVIRIRPEYYRKHRGLTYFQPSQYKVWKRPVVGWCSWYAYFDKVREEDVKAVTDVLSVKLKRFGLDYIQIDDGYQQVPIGLPDTWLQPNSKFPSGLTAMASYIKGKGFKPAIWTNVSFADSAKAFQNASLFIKDDKGKPAYGNWVGYVMDGSNPASINQLISPVYSGLKKYGWEYYKLDALRHLKYEGYNSFAGYFRKNNIDRNEAYRNVVKDVRKQIGNENFLLACWGPRPELVGIADGCRIGDDGYSYAGLAQYNSYNNIIWRNDPDHIVLSEKEAYRSCVATSLTGSLFMVTDKPEKYSSSPLIDAAQRSIPVLYTQPGQVYDIDPSVSSKIALADVELSGSGPRPFDASASTTTGLFSLELNKPFENWLVLGRLDERDPVLPMKDMGLDPTKDYLVFEFWTKKFMGIHQKQLVPGPIDPKFNCQVFCFREKMNHPQLLATNRHISCGGYEISKAGWKDKEFFLEAELVDGDDYKVYLYEPDGFEISTVNCEGGKLLSNDKEGFVRTITIQGKTKANIKLQYK